VLSAITANGVEVFAPWPSTRRITVAGDRDETKTGAGFKRGERAARRLALRLAQKQKTGGRPKGIGITERPLNPSIRGEYSECQIRNAPTKVNSSLSMI
jgi:hypothetical protein